MRRNHAGFSIVEVMVVVAIVAIVMSIAIPNYQVWAANTTMRAKSEAILNGLQLARSEALRRNARVQFVLTANGGWEVGCVVIVGDLNGDGAADCPQIIQQKSSQEAGQATMTTLPATSDRVTFNSVGMVTSNADTSASLTQVDFSVVRATRQYRVLVGAGGQSRLCDPSITDAGSPEKC